MIRIRSQQLGYQHPVFNNLNLTIHSGEKVALVGKSGCGKTTLLRHLFEISDDSGVALIPQHFDLVEPLSVFHNVYMGKLNRYSTFTNLKNLIFPQKKQMEKISTLLAELQLQEKLFIPAGSLSGGQKQRTAIARALYQNQPLLLADEPVSAIDESQSELVLQVLINHHQTCVLALHDTRLALKYSDRIIGIKDGELALDEKSSNLTQQDLSFLYR